MLVAHQTHAAPECTGTWKKKMHIHIHIHTWISRSEIFRHKVVHGRVTHDPIGARNNRRRRFQMPIEDRRGSGWIFC